jgi:tyrosyl-tRNA synthetase
MSETASNAQIPDLIAELDWRGLIKDCTDKDALRDHLRTPGRKIYAGFDPTADSLTIGNLVPIMMLAHVKRAGHTPVVVMGGGTGLIGDPSGKSAERQMMTAETVQHHVDCQRPIFENVLGQIKGPEHAIKNNLDWLGGISYIEALRDIGKHFSVNMMMQKESVRDRINNREQGISYTEFSYMILQAYDFDYLFEHEGITVQFGGSDQYGNIVAGCDLIRRHTEDREFRRKEVAGEDASSIGYDEQWFGLTAPLVSKADGGKFGKTESGAVWLTAARTSPYAYYQFWLNASDEDARNWVKVFTFLPQDEIEALIARHDEAPGKRELQRTLAQQATSILHGTAAMENAEAAGKALFSGDVGTLDRDTLVEVFASVPTTEHAKSELDGEGVDPVDLLIACNLASSKREAREFLGGGSVSVNGEKIDADTRINASHLLHGSYIAIRRGKKNWHMTKWA